MDLIKCPRCGEEYSDSYPCCPFCEEDENDGRRLWRAPSRHIASGSKAQSARGGLVVVLILVLALLSWYLFGDKLILREKDGAKPTHIADVQPPKGETSGESAGEASGAAQSGKTDGSPGELTGAQGGAQTDRQSSLENAAAGRENGASADGEQTAAPPPAQENVDASGAKLNRSDFTLAYAGETFRMKVSGTEATPHWSIDNPNVATLAADGTVTAVANGTTTVRCQVGSRELTCIVRVTGTGRSAAAADAPAAAEPAAPSAAPEEDKPAETGAPEIKEPETKPEETKPAESEAPAEVDASTLRVKTNVSGVLPKSDGKFDCTIRISGDRIRLVAIDRDGKAVSLNWSSSNSDIVTVGENGGLNPVSRGIATVTASQGGGTVSCIIRVRD